MKRIVWTEKRIIEEAKKFNNRTEFNRKCNGGYKMAIRLGIIDDIFPSHQGRRVMKSPEKWTVSSLKEISKKYDYRSDFEKDNKNAYNAACVYGIVDLLFEDKPNKGYKRKNIDKPIVPPKKPGRPSRWTKEKIIEEGRKYNTRLEFQKSCISGYLNAVRSGCLDEIFKDKPNLGYQKPRMAKGKKSNTATGHRKYWTEERVWQIVSTWQGSLTSLNKKYPGFNRTLDRQGLLPKLKEMRSRMYNSVPREQIEADAKKYACRTEFREQSPRTYWAAYYQNILDEVLPEKKRRKPKVKL